MNEAIVSPKTPKRATYKGFYIPAWGGGIPKQIEEGKKIIVFTHFKYETEYIASKLQDQKINYGIISGSVTIGERNKIIANKDLKVLLVQIVAGGTGLNLQDYN